MVNKAILLGRVGKDPELRRTASGTSVATFSLATNKKYTQNGEKKEKTTWHRIICYNKLADIVSQYVKKGRQIYVDGEIDNRQYEKDGIMKDVSEVIASNVTFIGGAHDEYDQRPRQEQFNQTPTVPQDDLPF